MSRETMKATHRRNQINFFGKFCQGKGIDIGCGPDPIDLKVDRWETRNGDAQYLKGIADETYDYAYSSHCLEHVVDPAVALANWWRIVKPGGFLIFQVPDEDLYEQGEFPSRFNPDHKHTFTISKSKSWSAKSINVIDLVKTLPNHKIVYLNLCDSNYDYTKPNNVDQTDDAKQGVEVSIECVIQKPVDLSKVVKLNENYRVEQPRPMVLQPAILQEPRSYLTVKDSKGENWLMVKMV